MSGRSIIALLACLAAACDEGPKPVARIADSGELVVLTVNGPTTYFEDAQGLPSGLEYDLAALFAKELKVRPTFILTDSPAKIDRLLREGQAHLAAASRGARPTTPPNTRSFAAPRRRKRRSSRTSPASASA